MLTFRLDDQGGPQPPPQPGWKEPQPEKKVPEDDEQDEKPQ